MKTLEKVFERMVSGKCVRLSKSGRESWENVYMLGQWFYIQKIHCDERLTLCGVNHQILENAELSDIKF